MENNYLLRIRGWLQKKTKKDSFYSEKKKISIKNTYKRNQRQRLTESYYRKLLENRKYVPRKSRENSFD